MRRTAHAARAQYLLDRGQQPVAILQHDPVELLALGLIHGACLQGFQIEPNGRHGRFQLVRDGIDEGVVLLVAADLAYYKDGVEPDAATDHQHQQNSQHQQDAVPPVQQEIADVENQQDGDQPDAQRDMPGDRSAAPGEFHNSRLARREGAGN